MNIALLLLTNGITVGLAVSLVSWLLKIWIDKKLSYSLSAELEKFKAKLAKEVSLHTIQNTWNHTKKVELLSQLYEYMLNADFQLKVFLVNIKLKKKDLIYSRANKFMENYLELNSCLHKNELFLEQPLVDDIQGTYKPFFELALMAIDEVSDSVIEEIEKKLPNSIDEIMDMGGKPRSRLVKRFKTEIGID
ncbi:hypothetical protein B1207_07550 [Legionella quinlivanii]|uniref:Uncharacterized protein n=1 Tax=Legionella quinlivanii TaxID=45073 RepID=A0A364LJY4_9GAMM|nr:hypothetical protein [Legionella quinlivanii]RAP36651.1 hypothetical protein B1207_07550 [Legionella quinlivanii]